MTTHWSEFDSRTYVPIYTVTNREDGVESRVFSRYDGQFSVSLTDLDSGQTFPLIKIFPLITDAERYADSLVKGTCLRIRTVCKCGHVETDHSGSMGGKCMRCACQDYRKAGEPCN